MGWGRDCDEQVRAASERDAVVIGQDGDFEARHLLPRLQPPGQLAFHMRLDPAFVRAGAEPVSGLLAVSGEVAVGEALEPAGADLGHVLRAMPLKRRAPSARSCCSPVHREAVARNAGGRKGKGVRRPA